MRQLTSQLHPTGLATPPPLAMRCVTLLSDTTSNIKQPRLKRRSCQFAFSAAHAMAVSWTEVTLMQCNVMKAFLDNVCVTTKWDTETTMNHNP
jgi:hypothetical protein